METLSIFLLLMFASAIKHQVGKQEQNIRTLEQNIRTLEKKIDRLLEARGLAIGSAEIDRIVHEELCRGPEHLLREYRTRLIADVVAGKLDVREAAAALPDVLDKAEQAVDVEEAVEEVLDEAEGGEVEKTDA